MQCIAFFPVSTRTHCFRNDLEEKTISGGGSLFFNTFLGSEKNVTNQEERAGSSDKVVRCQYQGLVACILIYHHL